MVVGLGYGHGSSIRSPGILPGTARNFASVTASSVTASSVLSWFVSVKRYSTLPILSVGNVGNVSGVLITKAGTQEGKVGELLSSPHRRSGGRNHRGRITVYHRGGGAKRRNRIVVGCVGRARDAASRHSHRLGFDVFPSCSTSPASLIPPREPFFSSHVLYAVGVVRSFQVLKGSQVALVEWHAELCAIESVVSESEGVVDQEHDSATGQDKAKAGQAEVRVTSRGKWTYRRPAASWKVGSFIVLTRPRDEGLKGLGFTEVALETIVETWVATTKAFAEAKVTGEVLREALREFQAYGVSSSSSPVSIVGFASCVPPHDPSLFEGYCATLGQRSVGQVVSNVDGIFARSGGTFVTVTGYSNIVQGLGQSVVGEPEAFLDHKQAAKNGSILENVNSLEVGSRPGIAEGGTTRIVCRLPSGEVRGFDPRTVVTLGASRDSKDSLRVKLCSGNKRRLRLLLDKTGKAGRTRHLGFRSIVRGVARNPIDHPHGGGEGKSSGGRPSVTPWGKPTKGQPTSRSRNSDRIQDRRGRSPKRGK